LLLKETAAEEEEEAPTQKVEIAENKVIAWYSLLARSC